MGVQDINMRDLLVAVRCNLEQAGEDLKRSGKEPLFQLETLELELKFVVEEATEIKGGFNVKIVSVGGAGSDKAQQTQTIRLKYQASKNAIANAQPGVFGHATTAVAPTPEVSPIL